MANLPISGLTAASTPLAGTEVLPIVQSGATVKVAVSDLTAGRAVTTGALTTTGAFTSPGIDDNRTTEGLQLADTQINILTNTLIGSLSVAPDGTLHVHTATAGSVTASALADDLVVENSGDGGISILVPDANLAALNFGTPADSVGARLRWDYTSSQFQVGSGKVGASMLLCGDNVVTNLTLSGASGSELATFAGDVTLSEGRLIITDTANEIAHLVTSSATTANANDIVASSLTTGSALRVYSNSSDSSERSLIFANNDNTAATGASVAYYSQDAAVQVMRLDQNASASFIDYRATAAANTTAAISTLTTSGATTGHIQIEINGAKAWIAVSTNNPS